MQMRTTKKEDMERITFHSRSTKKKGIQVVFRLREGRDVQITHKSDIIADLVDLNKLNPNGSPKDRVSIYNEELSKSLKDEFEIMTSAYAYMCGEGLDITSEVFEREITRIKTPVIAVREETPSLITSAVTNATATDTRLKSIRTKPLFTPRKIIPIIIAISITS